MSTRKWSKQGFLNPADSNDDGWFKFSIRPYRWGFGDVFIISDCSNKIYLEFNVDAYNEHTSKVDLKKRLRQVEARRKKLRLFKKVVSEACDKFLVALDDVEDELLDLLDQSTG